MLDRNIRRLINVSKGIWGMLTAKQRRNFKLLQLINLVNSIIQPLAVIAVLPAFSLVITKEVSASNEYYMWVMSYLGMSHNMTRLVIVSASFFILILSQFVSLAADYVTYKIGAVTKIEHQSILFSYYLYSPYAFFVNVSSSSLTAKLYSYIDYFVAILVNLSGILTHSFVTLSMMVMLIYKETLIASILSVVCIGIYSFMVVILRKRALFIGEKQRDADEKSFQIIKNAMDGIKEIKMQNLEGKISSNYTKIRHQGAFASLERDVVSIVPKHVIMTIIYLVLLLLSLTYIFVSSEGDDSFLTLLVLFGLAGTRIIPAIQRVYNNVFFVLASAAYYKALKQPIDSALKALKTRSQTDVKVGGYSVKLEKEIRFDKVSFRYDNKKNYVLKDVSLSIPIGWSVGFVGSSGSGKTTCINMLLSLLKPTQGDIFLDNIKLNDSDSQVYRTKFSYVPQSIFLFDDTIAKNIAFGYTEVSVERLEQVIKDSELSTFIDSLPDGYHTKIGDSGVRLSGGQRQRIGIARAFYMDSEITVMDEATSSMDVLTEASITRNIEKYRNRKKDRRKTLIIVAHRLSTVRKCDIIYVFNKGRVEDSGTYNELVAKNSTFRRMVKKLSE